MADPLTTSIRLTKPTVGGDSGNWGVVSRNVIGSPGIDLRSGPAAPPLGKGSLKLLVGDGTEKAAYGNEVDFIDAPLASITAASFGVYTTGENRAISPANLPSLAFEVDPSGPGSASAPALIPAGTPSLTTALSGAIRTKSNPCMKSLTFSCTNVW